MTAEHWTKAGAAAVILIAAGLTLYYVLYGFPKPVAHARFQTEQTALRLMLRPAHLQHIVSDAAPDGLKLIPAMPRLNSAMGRPQRLDWLHYLPYEIALLAQQAPTGDLDCVLFVNPNTNGPDFAALVADSRALSRPVLFQWRPPNLTEDTDGGLVTRGTLELPDEAWEQPQAHMGGPFRLPEPDGRLLADFAADNAGAILQTLHDQLRQRHGVALGDHELDENLSWLWEHVQTIRLAAELIDDETIGVTLTARLMPGFTDISSIDRIAAGVRAYLSNRAGLEFEGAHSLNGLALEGEYRIVGIGSRLHDRLGRRGI